MDYPSALHYLYGLTDYETERIIHYDPDTLDPSRVKRVLARLGDPHQRFSSIHVAGTKGKGSVAVMCASVLQAAGLRTGLYTSPHLHTFRERIQVNGEPIPPDALAELVQVCRPTFDTEPELTTFEAITALAFVHFAQRSVDFAVVEVGLGGRLDATNVITPQVAIITSLSFDHTYLLGNTLADIAREKAGIIKPGVPTVSAPQDAEALDVIQQVCDERRSPLTLVGREWTWRSPDSPSTPSGADDYSLRLEGQSFELHCSRDASPLEGTYTISLLGRHQLNNAATAIAALDLLRRAGVALHPHHLRQGLVNLRWPGRFEILQQDPPLVVDCAHNADSVAKLVATLQEWFPGRQWTFILGISQDKDLTGMLQALAPLAERILVTQSRHLRAMPSQRLARLAVDILAQLGAPHVEVKATSDAGEALNVAFNPVSPGHDLPSMFPHERQASPICATGSIFLVADVREVWALYTSRDIPPTDEPLAGQLHLLGQDLAAQMEAINR